MSNYIFIFDLDSTITKSEILPTISKKIGKEKEMQDLTERTMNGEIPFKNSFLNRVEILSNEKVSDISSLIEKIPLNKEIVKFIIENKERCYVLTGNLDVWIKKLMNKIGLENHLYSSKAHVKNDYIENVISVIDKELMIKQFVQPMVIIGDGDNDTGMAIHADISIGYGGVRNIAPSLLRNIDFAFYDDKRCADFLRTLL